MKAKDELKKGVKELVIALLKCKPTKDKEIIDFNVRAFMGGFEDYLSYQSDASDSEIEKLIWEEISVPLSQKDIDNNTDNYITYLNAVYWAKWMRDTPTPKKVSFSGKCFRCSRVNCICKEGEKELPWSVNAEDYLKEWKKNPIKELKDKEEPSPKKRGGCSNR